MSPSSGDALLCFVKRAVPAGSKCTNWYRSVNAAVEHLRALEKKGVITIKRGVARGITLHTTVKDDDSEAAGIIRALLAGEENARLRAAHWLHERGLKV